MGWRAAVFGGVIGYVVGLFFKGAVGALITFKFPSASQYLTSIFAPASIMDAISGIVIPLPFALLGAGMAVLYFRGRTPVVTPVS